MDMALDAPPLECIGVAFDGPPHADINKATTAATPMNPATAPPRVGSLFRCMGISSSSCMDRALGEPRGPVGILHPWIGSGVTEEPTLV